MRFTSKRLIFSKITTPDLVNYLKLTEDKKVMRFISGDPFSKEKGKERFAQIIDYNSNNNKTGFFSITLKSTSEFIGYAKLTFTTINEAEMGYMFLPDFWGKGFGTEVSNRMIDYAKSISEIKQIMAITDPENTPSKKILKNKGFKLNEITELDGLPAEIYRLNLIDFEQADN